MANSLDKTINRLRVAQQIESYEEKTALEQETIHQLIDDALEHLDDYLDTLVDEMIERELGEYDDS